MVPCTIELDNSVQPSSLGILFQHMKLHAYLWYIERKFFLPETKRKHGPEKQSLYAQLILQLRFPGQKYLLCTSISPTQEHSYFSSVGKQWILEGKKAR
jgi:hypothetical protein